MDGDGWEQGEGGCCPHLDHNDAGCATRLNLGRIDQAFSVCFGSFRTCPTYRRITIEREAAERVPQVEVMIGNGDVRIPVRAAAS